MKVRIVAYIKVSVSMIIFGSIGIFIRNIPLSSSAIAMFRALIGACFLLAISVIQRNRLSSRTLNKHLPVLLISGAALGFNWILLFESYRYTSVAVSTLCYYTAPILVIFLSPVLLKEHLSRKKLACVIPTVLGMIFVSGVLTASLGDSDWKGILLGLGAAVLYAGVVILNKMQPELPSFDRTFFQLTTAAMVLLPYNLAVCGMPSVIPDSRTLFLMAVVGIIHTGLAYYLYFSALPHLEGHSVAVISYVDPVVAVGVSVFLLHEKTSWQEMLGALLILGASVISELPSRKKAFYLD